jgi:hydrogenase maturation protein HypF
VRGTVQGVGFRPFVYRQATSLSLFGWVGNSDQGVTVEVEGETLRIEALLTALQTIPPVHAHIVSIETQEIAPRGETGFTIRSSTISSTQSTEITPDLATCDDCLRELLDQQDRRHLYPFINCTNCGPRYTIVEAIPYDRARTSMRHFPMCEVCQAEYDNPADRRFHAEPNACPDCGPRLALWDTAGTTRADDHAALTGAAQALRQGQIVAVKGIGGFHLLVDATNQTAVSRLRQRKQRDEKPFAAMFPSLAAIAACCDVGPVEAAALSAPPRPIVLLRRRNSDLAPSVAPGNPWLGALLPYAPLHHLLMRELGFPVVATSGNRGGEPIVFEEQQAILNLDGIADLFLVHDRPIVRPVDDSVVRVVCGREMILRHARGHAPKPIPVNGVASGILALGGHLKTTIAVTRPRGINLSQHLGDLETTAARQAHAAAVGDAGRLFAATPRLVVRDLHPDYASSQTANAMGLPVVSVQHHVAHVASCMAEHKLAPPLLGVAWDGTGYGPDGTVWGGEFLLIAPKSWHRVAHLRGFRLPGSDVAAREPRRAALGMLFEAFGDDAFAMTDLAPIAAFSSAELAVLRRMLVQRVNAPVCSSAGRLFDAFAALCALRQHSSYEGQAAAELEWAAETATTDRTYEFSIRDGNTAAPIIVDWQPPLVAALADRHAGVDVGTISAALHRGLAAAIVAISQRIGQRRVILTGGCFQNARLTEAAVAALREADFEPIWHHLVPPNDGGLAVGQAAWAGWQEQAGERACASPFPA